MSWSAVNRPEPVKSVTEIDLPCKRFEIEAHGRRHVQVRLDEDGVFLAHEDCSKGQGLQIATIPVDEFAEIVRELIANNKRMRKRKHGT